MGKVRDDRPRSSEADRHDTAGRADPEVTRGPVRREIWDERERSSLPHASALGERVPPTERGISYRGFVFNHSTTVSAALSGGKTG